MTKAHFPVAVLGNWHLAHVTMAGLLQLGHKGIFVLPPDSSTAGKADGPATTASTETDAQTAPQGPPQLNLEEPGVNDILAKAAADGRMAYTNAIDDAFTADYVWLAVDTPVDHLDRPDVTPLLTIIEQVAQAGIVKKALIITSQVPLGFCQRVQNETGIPVVCIPENLRLGQGLTTFLTPDRLVIGAQSESLRNDVRKLLQGIQASCFLCDLPTAEMVKHATNAYLATSISLANELAKLGETYEVDNHLVGRALKADQRIGAKAYCLPGRGFAGGTLPRDLKVLRAIGEEHNLPTKLIDSVLSVNSGWSHTVLRTLKDFFGGDVQGRRVLLLGLSYKADTNTLRRSPATELAPLLREAGMQVSGFDPAMASQDLSPLADLGVTYVDKWEGITQPPDAVVVITARPSFADLPWETLFQSTKKETSKHLFYDLDGAFSAQRFAELGVFYKVLYQPCIAPKQQPQERPQNTTTGEAHA